MKKLFAALCLFLVGAVAAAVWFSPLCGVGELYAYENNVATENIDGVCYPPVGSYRVDFDGDEDELYAALDRINARVVRSERVDDLLIVYAYSPRVAASVKADYNIMAACRAGRVSIGAPVLEGSY